MGIYGFDMSKWRLVSKLINRDEKEDRTINSDIYMKVFKNFILDLGYARI